MVARQDADRLGLGYDFLAGWITLQVHSALAAVGLTAAASAALTDAGISCNVLAGYHHDHLLVPLDRVEQALNRVARPRRSSPAGDAVGAPEQEGPGGTRPSS